MKTLNLESEILQIGVWDRQSGIVNASVKRSCCGFVYNALEFIDNTNQHYENKKAIDGVWHEEMRENFGRKVHQPTSTTNHSELHGGVFSA